MQLNRRALKGVVEKSAALGGIGALIGGAIGGWDGALGVLAGVALVGLNVIGIALLVRRSVRADGASAPRAGGALVMGLFVLKLLVLFTLAYYVLAVIGLSPIGFVSGCMIALGALSWQVVSTP